MTITGSSAAGDSAYEVCARRRIPLQAELGGNNASIVWSDADLQEAARMIAAGAFEMAGQRCTANRRVIVHEACLNEFVELLVRATSSLKWGDPLDGDTDIGPLVSVSHRDRVASTVDRAVALCGRPLLPLGDQLPMVEEHAGKFYPPTILFLLRSGMRDRSGGNFRPSAGRAAGTGVGGRHAPLQRGSARARGQLCSRPRAIESATFCNGPARAF